MKRPQLVAVSSNTAPQLERPSLQGFLAPKPGAMNARACRQPFNRSNSEENTMEKGHRKHSIFIAAILGPMLAVLALPSFAQVVKNSQTRLDQLTFSSQELRVSQ